jgi:cytochrome o ubiquinol oxidase subunit 2
MRWKKHLALLAFLPALNGCAAIQLGVVNHAGLIAEHQWRLYLIVGFVLIFVALPVLLLTPLVAWHYRLSNKRGAYRPRWNFSWVLEFFIWVPPTGIVIGLAFLLWNSTHELDPYRSISSAQPALEVQVVALDWKWLFIYPQYGIATVNELAAPLNRPIDFKITASSVMNSFYIPALAGQIYAMPGMETRLNAVVNTAGSYQGISANYSGAGFSGMHFTFKGLADADFDNWIAGVKAASGTLDRTNYLSLERPSENEPVRLYASVDAQLYDAVLNMCVEAGKMCQGQMAAIDAKGGLGLAGVHNLIPIAETKTAAEGTDHGPTRVYVASICTQADNGYGAAMAVPQVVADTSPLTGAGLPMPNMGFPAPQSTASLGLPAWPPNS